MIKEIQEIAKQMAILNDQVYGAILSNEDLELLENNLATIHAIQNEINHLLHELSLTSTVDTKQLIRKLADIHQLISQLATAFDQIQELSSKFVCNYREEWNNIQKNVA